MNINENYFAISGGLPVVDSGKDMIAIVKASNFGLGDLLYGRVENRGSATLTIYLYESDDNDLSGTGDDYASMNFYVRSGAGTATASTLVILPGGMQTFLVILNQTHIQARFLKFLATVGGQGMLGLSFWSGAGQLDRVSAEQAPA